MNILNDDDFAILSSKALLGDMLSMIVHQWKQPLSIINILSTNMDFQLEMNNFDKERFLTWNKQLQEQIQYMSETIDDFRDFSDIKKEKNRINVQNCIQRAIRFTNIILTKNEISLEVYYHTKDLEILAFHNDICQILIILISNAKDKFLLLDLESKKIIIEVSENDLGLLITVKDNGGIINEEILKNIFQENFTTKEDKRGNGLGLFIANKIIKEHLDGKIWVENLCDENSVRFCLLVPTL
ncbi:MAG: HAMP domain-containing sensor histidine kinase [Arcobacteraceae bacterium]|jgi:C4-dicarboxylate-specific signal transduction histidine kinase|nr:HAMP domain-containing sensor histidine kinase [Arcobacteraceae bacterium]